MENLPLIDDYKIHFTSEPHATLQNGSAPQGKNLEPFRKSDNAAASDVYYCHLCCVHLENQYSQCEHLTSFLHRQLRALKYELLRTGIKDQFWILEQFPTQIQAPVITCTICSVTSTSEDNFLKHIKGYKHQEAYNSWLTSPSRELVEAVDYKNNCFYCKICDKPLNGTSDAVSHYTGRSHISNLQDKKLVIHTPNPTVTELPPSNEVLETPINHMENVQIEDDNIIRKPNTENVKQQVFSELEKLLEKLYYSPSVSYDRALKFLKKVNKDVDALAEEHKKHNELKEATNGELCHKSINHEIIVESKRNKSTTAITTLTPTSCNDVVIHKSIKTEAIADENLRDSPLLAPALSDNNWFTSNAKDIPSLLREIVQRREKVDRECNGKVSIEKELLQEFENIIKQIDQEGIHVDLLVNCLKDSNNYLELFSRQTVARANIIQVEKQAKARIFPGFGLFACFACIFTILRNIPLKGLATKNTCVIM